MEDPFDLLPPLSTEEYEALKADIKANGVLHPVLVDEDGNVLDGRHRLKIAPDAPRKVLKGLTPAEKEATVFRANFVRRNLSPDQKNTAKKKMQSTAFRLREEDAKKWTLKRIGQVLGVHLDTVSGWFTTNSELRNSSKSTVPGSVPGSVPAKPRPDARVKVNPSAKPDIAARVEKGESQAQVAADLGVSQQTVSNIVNSEKKKSEAKKEKEEQAAKIEGDCGILEGDFRTVGSAVEDGSIDLIFTDPPYDEEAVALYGDLATFAARVLRPGGWLLAYSGQAWLPQIFDAMRGKGLEYGWTFSILHSGGDLRFRKFKVQNGWKPILGFFKPPLSVTWDWFKDVATGGKEKSDHEWQQAESEAAHFISHLSVPKGFVCDPFAGSGTSLAAAKSLGRRWLGMEINPEHVKTARLKLQ